MKNKIIKYTKYLYTLIFTFFISVTSVFADETVHVPIKSQITIDGIINTIYKLNFGFAIFMTVIYLPLAAIKFITAGGDEQKILGARRAFTSVLIGFTITILTFAIIRLVVEFFGVGELEDLLNLIPSRMEN